MKYVCTIGCLHIIIDAFHEKLTKKEVLTIKAYNSRYSKAEKYSYYKHLIMHACL